MAVEDEIRGGPVYEPKTKIFADQVCETASSLVEFVRCILLSHFSSLPPAVMIFVCCTFVLPVPHRLTCLVPDLSSVFEFDFYPCASETGALCCCSSALAVGSLSESVVRFSGLYMFLSGMVQTPQMK